MKFFVPFVFFVDNVSEHRRPGRFCAFFMH